MRLFGPFFSVSACVVAFAMPTGCGGSVVLVDGGGGGNGGAESSSSGSPGTGPSSNGGESSSSSGGPVTSPQCAGLVAPAIAKLCPDGTTVATPYYAWDGAQCLLTFPCPPSAVVNPGGPIGSSSSGSSSGVASVDSGFVCTSAASCGAGLVCCGALTGASPGTLCQVGPCPFLPIINMSVQFCSVTSECHLGQICEKVTTGILAQVLMGITVCQAPPMLDASTE